MRQLLTNCNPGKRTQAIWCLSFPIPKEVIVLTCSWYCYENPSLYKEPITRSALRKDCHCYPGLEYIQPCQHMQLLMLMTWSPRPRMCARTSGEYKEIGAGRDLRDLGQLHYLLDFNSELWAATSSSTKRDMNHLLPPKNSILAASQIQHQWGGGDGSHSASKVAGFAGNEQPITWSVWKKTDPFLSAEEWESKWHAEKMSTQSGKGDLPVSGKLFSILSSSEMPWVSWGTQEGLCFSLPCFLTPSSASGSSDVWMNCNCMGDIQK